MYSGPQRLTRDDTLFPSPTLFRSTAISDRVAAGGGMAKALDAGWAKAMMETAAGARQARVDRGEDVNVGVNKYRLANEDLLETLEVDNTKVREAQIARINKMKEIGRASCRERVCQYV